MFDVFKRDPQREIRFGRPEFKEKLTRAREYARRQMPLPTTFWSKVLHKVGFRSLFTQILGLVLVGLIGFFLTISHMFLITQIKLNNTDIREDQVRDVLRRMQSKRMYLIPSNHMAILNEHSLLAAIQKDIPEVRKITSFKRILPNRLELSLEKRTPLFVWHTGEGFYLVDQDGVIYQKILNYQQDTYSQIVIIDKSFEDIAVGQALPIEKLLNFLNKLQDAWSEKISQTDYVAFSIPALSSPDLNVHTTIGFEIYFDLDRGVPGQLANLSLLLSSEIKPETYSGLSYIDLRLPNIAYYCYKDSPCAIENLK